ncbi:MAG: ATP-binding cassette domain-containing protein [Mycoplasmataceae bacterium]|jgi:Fe-S cluster assembly ATP-binding protein|nr:ATP-binding cassette domain-containing protein [Mycoplasmataceae bacterium]
MKFSVKKLNSFIGNKQILNNISFSLKTGDVLAVMGTNGGGKTTLLKSIMNHFSLKNDGEIKLNNTSLSSLSTYDIAKNKIFYIPQVSLELIGVQTLNFLRLVNSHSKNESFSVVYKKIEHLFKYFNLPKEILTRDLNVNFSGGQKKKLELIQSEIFGGDVLLIDEIDSGVDHDSIKAIAKYINSIKKTKIIIVISHNTNFLNMIKPTKTIIINNGKIVKSGSDELIKLVEKKGYKQFCGAKEKPLTTVCLTKQR